MEGTSKATSAGRSPDDPPTAGRLMVAVGTLGGNQAVLSLAGEFDLSNIEAAESGLTEAATKSDDVVIDLSGLTYIDSSGIAFLMGAAKTLGPRLSVRESNHPAVTRLLELVGLRSYFRQPELTDAWLTSRR